MDCYTIVSPAFSRYQSMWPLRMRIGELKFNDQNLSHFLCHFVHHFFSIMSVHQTNHNTKSYVDVLTIIQKCTFFISIKKVILIRWYNIHIFLSHCSYSYNLCHYSAIQIFFYEVLAQYLNIFLYRYINLDHKGIPSRHRCEKILNI